MAEIDVQNSQLSFESEKRPRHHFAVCRIDVKVEGRDVPALLKSNCSIPVADRGWLQSIPSRLIVTEYGVDWAILLVDRNRIRTQYTCLIADIFATTGYSLILPWPMCWGQEV